MKIYVAICTYNRLETLRKMASSFKEVTRPEETSINIFDDASTNFGKDTIESLFPDCENIFFNIKNIGSDGNIYKAMNIFAESKYDCLVLFDSDLVFRSNALVFVEKNLQVCGGFMCLYNSILHSVVGHKKINGINYVLKNDVGSAGTAFSKEIIMDILKDVPVSRKYDWDWSKYMRLRSLELKVVEKSLVQHIGFEGYNCNYYSPFEIGKGFYPDNTTTMNIYLDTVENIMIRENQHKNLRASFWDAGIFLKNSIKCKWRKYLKN
jgi:Predicted glycosyltransferases